MTTHIVADDTLGTISRRMWEVQRRLMEGTLDPSFVVRNLQSIVETQEVTSTPLVTASPFFADEEMESNYGYPQGYVVKPIGEQLVELSRHFNDLNTKDVLAYSKKLPALPAGAEGWFAVPRWWSVHNSYNNAVKKVLDLIDKTRILGSNIGPKHLRMSERTSVALQMLNAKQNSDFLLIPAQFGLAHRGRSVRRVRVVYTPNEFGLGSFIVGCMILSHPERFVQLEQLHSDCPGDEFSPNGDGMFSHAPFFHFHDGRVRFNACWAERAYEGYGSASGFVPAVA